MGEPSVRRNVEVRVDGPIDSRRDGVRPRKLLGEPDDADRLLNLEIDVDIIGDAQRLPYIGVQGSKRVDLVPLHLLPSAYLLAQP